MVQDIKSKASLLFKTREELAPTNIAGLYFDIIQEHNISIQNSITDNWVENNTAIADHIAHQPLIITLRGISGEIVFVPPTKTLDTLYKGVNSAIQNRLADGKMANNNVIIDKLTLIPALLPPVDNITQLAKNAVQYIESSYKLYEKIIKNFTNNNRESHLWQIYRELEEISASNTAMIVETPFKVFDNMYIQSINFTQGNQLYSADIVLTLKQINFTETLTTGVDEKTMAKYNAYARAKQENHGLVPGKTIDNSILNDKFGNGASYKNYGTKK